MLKNIRWDLCRPDLARPLLAGVSGGADSLTLLHVLHTAGYPLIVAHFNHKLRPEADLETARVETLALSLGLRFVSASADVAAFAAENGLSLEEAARKLRYRFLFEAARKNEAQAVATGHTADDQAETVLMHFLRGAGLNGLKGMQARTLLPEFDAEIPLVRPLLGVWRAETEAYCQKHGLEPVFDPSNADTTYLRNRLRHTLIPELQTYNPRIKDVLVRTAQALQGDYELLAEVLEAAWQKSVRELGEGFIAFERHVLVEISAALRRNVIRKGAFLLRPGARDVDFAALERLSDFVEASDNGQVDLSGGLYLAQEADRVYLAAYESDLPCAQWPQVEQAPTLNDQRLALVNGWALAVEEMLPEAENWRLNADPWSAWLDARI